VTEGHAVAVHLSTVMIDVDDLDTAAAFWGAFLGVGEVHRSDTYVFFAPDRPDGANLALQRVPEPKQTKSRAHPDLHVDDLDAEVARVEQLGGEALEEHVVGPYRWRVCRDPVGSEFCLVAAAPG
jgi:predicted enzyme related to lactoylglutathione lyase